MATTKRRNYKAKSKTKKNGLDSGRKRSVVKEKARRTA